MTALRRIILVLLAFLLVGCGEKAEYYPIQTNAIEYTEGDITLEVTGRGMTGEAERIIGTVVNNSERKIYYSALCSFHVYIDGQWYFLYSKPKGNEATTSILYHIEPGESLKDFLDVGILEPGKYRIRACFWFEPVGNASEKYYLDYEFEIK